jgi:hypothetical protein
MTDPVLFPKTHKSFADDPVTLRVIARVEDIIELRYQTLSIKHAIEPIISFFSQPASKQPQLSLPPELLADLEELAAMPSSRVRTQLDEDQEAIWAIKARSGSLYVLGFLEPKLLLSLETLFSGIVVGYIQMFNDSKTRLRLSPDSVFKNSPDLKEFHVTVIQRLRDLQYAHKNAVEGQQSLTYTINEANEISINQDPPHFGFEFYPENYEKLYRCVCTLAKYLDSEVSNTSNQLMSRLNEEQLVALRAEWKAPARTRKTTKPIDYREPKAKIPKSGNGEPA